MTFMLETVAPEASYEQMRGRVLKHHGIRGLGEFCNGIMGPWLYEHMNKAIRLGSAFLAGAFVLL